MQKFQNDLEYSKPSLNTKKIDLMDFLAKRDGGFDCLFCKMKLVLGKQIIEHLNSDRSDNRLENLALACQPCNIKKIHSIELQNIAKKKLESNEKASLANYKHLEDSSHREASTEIEIGQKNFEITKQFLFERIKAEGSIEYSNALHSSAFICKEKTGYGSQQSARNYIDMLTCEVGPLMITKNEKKNKTIVMRYN